MQEKCADSEATAGLLLRSFPVIFLRVESFLDCFNLPEFIIPMHVVSIEDACNCAITIFSVVFLRTFIDFVQFSDKAFDFPLQSVFFVELFVR